MLRPCTRCVYTSLRLLLLSNKLDCLGLNKADGMMIRWEFLYFTFIISIIKNQLDTKKFRPMLLQQKFLKY